MKKVVVGLMVAVAALGGSYAVRQELALAAPAAPAESTAVKLAKLVMSKDSYKLMLVQTTQGMVQGMKQSGQTLPADFEKKAPLVVGEALPYDELIQFTAQVYGSRFSEKELNDIIAFYKTPTGVKLSKELPGIVHDTSAKVASLMPQRLPALMKKHGLLK